jgi:hypothetical protein
MQCGIHIAIDAQALNTRPCHREAVRECCDCGIKLCREHEVLFEDQYWCECCLYFYQTEPFKVTHVPAVQ